MATVATVATIATAPFTPRAWLCSGLALLSAMAAMAPFVAGRDALGGTMQGPPATLVPSADGADFGAWLGTPTLLVFAQASVKQIGWRHAGVPVLGSLLLGVACGHALLLFERERERER